VFFGGVGSSWELGGDGGERQKRFLLKRRCFSIMVSCHYRSRRVASQVRKGRTKIGFGVTRKERNNGWNQAFTIRGRGTSRHETDEKWSLDSTSVDGKGGGEFWGKSGRLARPSAGIKEEISLEGSRLGMAYTAESIPSCGPRSGRGHPFRSRKQEG